jgi:hypothetical protein
VAASLMSSVYAKLAARSGAAGWGLLRSGNGKSVPDESAARLSGMT